MVCKVYQDRPEICKQFPLTKGEIAEWPGCGYWFDEKGERHGECYIECPHICCVDVPFFGVMHELCPFFVKE